MTNRPPSNTATWALAYDGYDPQRERAERALFSLAAGGIGTSGGPLLTRGSARPWLLVSGLYDGDGPETHLLPGPVVEGLAVADADARQRRVLDLRSGVLREMTVVDGAPVDMVRFASLTRPGIIVARSSLPPGLHRDPVRVVTDRVPAHDRGATDDGSWTRVTGDAGGIVTAARDVAHDGFVDTFVAVSADPTAAPDPASALDRLGDAVRHGFDTLLAEQEEAWARRWESADIVIEGDDELQRAVRFSLFHLMAGTADTGEAAVGARGVSGTGYRGHVFWDADTFVLPFLAATYPPAARAMLEYRLRRLPVAIEEARALGREGARFPWESAATGRDVTPRSAVDRAGHTVPILTGLLEEHIVAQVAWSACQYIAWTGDDEFAQGPGLTLLVETARYWASRVRFDDGGRAHIEDIIGPDEYHEHVDDNAFTNIMARWNLRTAADAVDAAGPVGREILAGEPARWRRVASALVDGYDEMSGVYEQFAGFHHLEPLIIAEIAPRRPIAADLWLGAERVRGAQVIKQADVLMLHHLVPAEVASGSLRPNLDFYEPRTAHGSSLSPAVHALLLARAGQFSKALDALHIASRIDLDDLTGTTATGLHVATMGGLWQAMVFGFAGVRPCGRRLHIDPRLPPSWDALDVRVCFRGTRVEIRIEADRLRVTATAPGAVIDLAGTTHEAGPGGIEFRKVNEGWEVP